MVTKTCFKCGETKELGEFYVHSEMFDGHLNKCKQCVKAYAKQRRLDSDRPRELDTKRYQTDPVRRSYTFRRAKVWRANNPEKYRAHYLIYGAIKRGKMKRQACEVCGKPDAHAHHEDYSKPFDVRWLCPLHHAREHHAQ